jgi:hypothetical protein
VYDLGASRRVTAVCFLSGHYAETYVDVGVWFKGDATWYNPGSQACPGTAPANCVALPGPASSICAKNVRVYNPHTSISATGKAWEIGPFFDAFCCNYDEYWHTGTEPKAQTYKNELLFDICGSSSCNSAHGYNNVPINGGIIDVSKTMRNNLGASSTITNAYWRFA